MQKIATFFISIVFVGCATTNQAVSPSSLGRTSSTAAMESVMDRPGDVDLETVTSADWLVSLGGLLDLDNPLAQQAGLKERNEPVHIYVHLIRHPTRGVFLVDTGVPKSFVDDPGNSGISWLLRAGMHIERLVLHQSTEDIVSDLGGNLKGVFLSHAHIDHIAGLPAIPNSIPVYAGKSETTEKYFINMFVHGSSNHLFEGKGPVQEWQFSRVPDEPFAGVVDVFGDNTVFAIGVPGHTSGSTAYLVRTKSGPVLLVGDTSHTRWGWDNGVEPGDYTRDHEQNLLSLQDLKALVSRHPTTIVKLGHQP